MCAHLLSKQESDNVPEHQQGRSSISSAWLTPLSHFSHHDPSQQLYSPPPLDHSSFFSHNDVLLDCTDWIQTLHRSETCRVPRGILIILDFDSALWPTAEHELRGWRSPADIDSQLVGRLDGVVSQLLLVASSVATVVSERLCRCCLPILPRPKSTSSNSVDSHRGGRSIEGHVATVGVKVVTNARKKEHVERVLQTYLPRTNAVLKSRDALIEVISSLDVFGECTPFMERELRTFRHVVREFAMKISREDKMLIGAEYIRTPRDVQLVSLGDGEWERSAAFCVAKESPHFVDAIRSIKLVEHSTLRGQIIQTSFVVNNLANWICSADPVLDLFIQIECPNSDHDINSKIDHSKTTPNLVGQSSNRSSPANSTRASTPKNRMSTGDVTDCCAKFLCAPITGYISVIPANYDVLAAWKVAVVDSFRCAVDHLIATIIVVVSECPPNARDCACRINDKNVRKYCMLHVLIEIMPNLFQQLGKILHATVNKEASKYDGNSWLTVPFPSYATQRWRFLQAHYGNSRVKPTVCSCSERFRLLNQVRGLRECIGITRGSNLSLDVVDQFSALGGQPLNWRHYRRCPQTCTLFAAEDVLRCAYVSITVVCDVVEHVEYIPFQQRARLAYWVWKLMVKVAAQSNH